MNTKQGEDIDSLDYQIKTIEDDVDTSNFFDSILMNQMGMEDWLMDKEITEESSGKEQRDTEYMLGYNPGLINEVPIKDGGQGQGQGEIFSNKAQAQQTNTTNSKTPQSSLSKVPQSSREKDSGHGSDGDSDSSSDTNTGSDAFKRKKMSSGSGKNPSNATDDVTKAKYREHAKNTRMRKKNYIESLKKRLQELQDERQKIDFDRKLALRKLVDKVLTRKKVIQVFFFLRATGQLNRQKWESILEDSFELIQPITPYRSFPPHEVLQGQRHVKGVSGIIADTASQHIMIQSVSPVQLDDTGAVAVQYFSGPNESIVQDDTYMCKWQMFTTNAVKRGARYEVSKVGMIKAKFSDQNKLMKVELAFDAMSFMQQLRRATGRSEYTLIPNTVPLAIDHSEEMRLITESKPPFHITFANQSLAEAFNYSSAQLVGQPLSSLCYGAGLDQGQGQEKGDTKGTRSTMDNMHNKLLENQYSPVSTRIWLVSGDREPRFVVLKSYPLYEENGTEIRHYLRVVEPIFKSLGAGVGVGAPLNNILMNITAGEQQSILQNRQNLVNNTTAAEQAPLQSLQHSEPNFSRLDPGHRHQEPRAPVPTRQQPELFMTHGGGGGGGGGHAHQSQSARPITVSNGNASDSSGTMTTKGSSVSAASTIRAQEAPSSSGSPTSSSSALKHQDSLSDSVSGGTNEELASNSATDQSEHTETHEHTHSIMSLEMVDTSMIENQKKRNVSMRSGSENLEQGGIYVVRKGEHSLNQGNPGRGMDLGTRGSPMMMQDRPFKSPMMIIPGQQEQQFIQGQSHQSQSQIQSQKQQKADGDELLSIFADFED